MIRRVSHNTNPARDSSSGCVGLQHNQPRRIGEIKTCDHTDCQRRVKRYGSGFTFCAVHRTKMDVLYERTHVLGWPKIEDWDQNDLFGLYALLSSELDAREEIGNRLKENARRFYKNDNHQRRIDWTPCMKNKVRGMLDGQVELDLNDVVNDVIV